MNTVSCVRSWRLGILALLVAVMTTACGETPTTPSSSAPFSTEDLRVGTGLMAIQGSVVKVNYTLWLYDGSTPDHKGALVESNFDKGSFVFTLGSGAVIEGWDRGIVGMMEGGLRRIIIPPSLAYGDVRSGLIPPSSTLLFEVELLTVS
jgi:FKBP-type peptidyl-prolyl cis-trans isomerase